MSAGRPGQHYKVIDRMGEVIAVGSVSECAAKMDCNAEYLRRLIRGENAYPEHWVVPIQVEPTEDALVRSWNAFTEPLRREFGIPRYDPNKEAKR